MSPKSAYDGPLKLELVGDPAPVREAPGEGHGAIGAGAPLVAAPDTPVADSFLDKANKEFDQGRIDGPLWTRSVAEASGDKAKAKAAYLQARAMALQAPERVPGAASAGPQAWMPTASDELRVRPASRPLTAEGKTDRSKRSDAAAWVRSPAGILAMLTSLIVVVTLVYALWPRKSAVEETVGGTPRPAATTRSGQPMLTSNPADPQGPSQGFMKAVQDAKGTGNWNEVVQQALTWTRSEPGNAAAWNELSNGYVSLRQLDDAHAAARKTVELAPKDAFYWRSLGRLNLDREAPVEALLAFEEATLWNNKDAYSFVQAGILNTRLDRLPEAKLAFAKALAVNPEDKSARCGATLIAQKLARSDAANAGAGPAAPANGNCRELIERASAPVNSMGSTAISTAPASGH